jgi:hypothetical protein
MPYKPNGQMPKVRVTQAPPIENIFAPAFSDDILKTSEPTIVLDPFKKRLLKI